MKLTTLEMILQYYHLWDMEMVQKVIRDKDKASLENDDDEVSDED